MLPVSYFWPVEKKNVRTVCFWRWQTHQKRPESDMSLLVVYCDGVESAVYMITKENGSVVAYNDTLHEPHWPCLFESFPIRLVISNCKDLPVPTLVAHKVYLAWTPAIDDVHITVKARNFTKHLLFDRFRGEPTLHASSRSLSCLGVDPCAEWYAL